MHEKPVDVVRVWPVEGEGQAIIKSPASTRPATATASPLITSSMMTREAAFNIKPKRLPVVISRWNPAVALVLYSQVAHPWEVHMRRGQ